MRPPMVLVAGLVGILALAGCRADRPAATDAQPTPGSGVVPMEAAVLDLVTMRQEMFDRLDERFGPRRWTIDPNQRSGIGRAGCDAVGQDSRHDGRHDGEIALLPTMGFDGSYPEADWDDVARLVEQVGREHGFDRVGVVVDESGRHEIDGRDATGAQYVFGQVVNTGLLITSGCHVWATPPPDGRRAREPVVG